MKLSFSAQDEQFRAEVASWLRENLCGEFEVIRGRGGPEFLGERAEAKLVE